MKSELIWQEGIRFIGITESNHSIVIDNKKEFEGFDTAPNPMELLSLSLLGCAAMNVITILKKTKENIQELRLFFEGQQAQEPPKVFTHIKLTYQFKGKNINPDNIKKAVELTHQKYCPVGYMLQKAVPIEYEIKILED